MVKRNALYVVQYRQHYMHVVFPYYIYSTRHRICVNKCHAIQGCIGGIRGYTPFTIPACFLTGYTYLIVFHTLQYRRLHSALFLLEGFWGPEICLEYIGGRGSALDPAGGAQDILPESQTL